MHDKAFFLPLESRPKNYPPLRKMVGKFWHAGIIHDGKVYECFNYGRKSISDFDEEKKTKLKTMQAVFINVTLKKDKIDSELNSGIDCSEYVARAVGLSKNSGSKKEYWPEQVYNYILKLKKTS